MIWNTVKNFSIEDKQILNDLLCILWEKFRYSFHLIFNNQEFSDFVTIIRLYKPSISAKGISHVVYKYFTDYRAKNIIFSNEESNNIIELLDSFPLNYTAIFIFPNLKSPYEEKQIKEISIANNIKLFLYPENQNLPYKLYPIPEKQIRSGSVLTINFKGYLYDEQCIEEVKYILHQFLFWALQENLFEKSIDIENFTPLSINIKEKLGWIKEYALKEEHNLTLFDIPLNYQFTKLMNQLELNRLEETFKLKLEKIGRKINILQNNSAAEPIKTAIEWYFLAQNAIAPSQAFVLYLMGFEAILGLKNSATNFALLANRLAYLLNHYRLKPIVIESLNKSKRNFAFLAICSHCNISFLCC